MAATQEMRGIPEQGQLVEVRGQRFAVTDVKASSLPESPVLAEPQTMHPLVSLSSVEDDALGEELQVVWDIELTQTCGLIVTDLPPEQASIYWYSLRSWIECLFKDIKRGGFGWHHTKMECPQRAERLWLAIVVATLWLVSVGGRAEGLTSASSLCPEESRNREDYHTSKPATCKASSSSEDYHTSKPATCKASSSSTIDRPHSNPRWLSCFRRGALMILAALLKGLSLTPRAFETSVYPPFHLVPNG